MTSICGSCLCGKVHYEFNAEPVMVATCHCTHCRKQCGSAFSINVAVPADSVTLSGDTLTTYDDTGTSGQPVLRMFCNHCGSPTLSDVKEAGGLYFIKAGTLDDSSWVVPGAEIWCDSRVSWGAAGTDTPKMPANPPFG